MLTIFIAKRTIITMTIILFTNKKVMF